VLLDVSLPELDGFEVCRRIRSRPWGGQTLVIALTGWGDPEKRDQAREAGFDAYLLKPVEPADLQHLLSARA
jgi:two-component system CheB/CheR fusion protein